MKRYQVWMTGTLALALTIGGGLWANGQFVKAAPADTGTESSSIVSAADGERTGSFCFSMKGGIQSEELSVLLGLSTDELKETLKSGKSLADIAEEQNVDVQKVIDLYVNAGIEKLDQALADGRLTQEQYDERKAALNEKASQIVNGEIPFGKGMGGGRHHGGFAVMGYSEELAQLLGMTKDELTEALKSGKSLADIAGDQNVDVQKIIDLQVENTTAKLDQLLADGTITQEQYDSRKAELVDLVTKSVNGELSFGKGMKGKGHFSRGFGLGKPNSNDGSDSGGTNSASTETTASLSV
ncbi:SHOCT domain-containing protein [Paenibacillus tarimensis]